MTRPVDWSPLAASDPVPGDPEAVADLARRYRDTARAISGAARALRRATDLERFQGETAREFRSHAGNTADDIEKAYDRYDQAARALREFQPDHASAQELSAKALRQAKDADAAKRLAERRHDIESAKEEPDETLLARYEREADEAQQELDDARTMLDEAVDTYDRAAEKAARLIHDVNEHDGLKDSRWDKIWNTIEPYVKQIADIAGIVAAIAGVLALCVGWIPVIGQALAAVLGAVALIAGVISLVCNLALAIWGDGSWTDVLLDAIGVLTFGVGRLFTAGAKWTAALTRRTGWQNARDLVSRMPRSNRPRYQQLIGGQLRNPSNRKLDEMLRNPGAIRALRTERAHNIAHGLPRNFLTEAVAGAKTIWRNRSAFPQLIRDLPHLPRDFATTMEIAYRTGRGHGVAHVLAGNYDLAGDIAQLRRLDPRIIDGAVASQLSVTFRNSGISAGAFAASAAFDVAGFASMFRQ